MAAATGNEQSLIIQSLSRRGFLVLYCNPVKNLLVPLAHDTETIDSYYKQLRKYSFRLFLRDIIRFRDEIHLPVLQKYCSERTARSYLQLLCNWHIINKTGKNTYHLIPENINSFGDTFEWFVAQILMREFFSPAGWGIRLKETATGGDYDVICLIEGSLLYIEAKSSPPKHVDHS